MQCILCLKAPSILIHVFGEVGIRENINEIISKHFWFQPNIDDPKASYICSPCWYSLHSFHIFYNGVEAAYHHLRRLESNNSMGNIQQEPTAMNFDTNFNECNLSSAQIKIEMNDDSNDQPLEFNQDIILEDPLKTKIEYDSESEVPLAQLSTEGNRNQESQITESKSAGNKEAKSNEEVIYHIKDGVWLATCFAEETTDKRISPEEFDKFLKLNMTLSCEICLQPMETFTKLQVHFYKEHNNAKAFVTCCDKKFQLRAALVDHILLHKFPNYFTCVQCPKILTGRKTLQEHEKTHNKKLVYQCPGCDKSFHRKVNLDRHKDVHIEYSERTHKCSECEKLFASKFSLKQHMYDVHKTHCPMYICELCGIVCRDQPSLRRHQFEHTGGEKERFPCDLCDSQLASKDGLRRHKKFQHPAVKKDYICGYCGLQSKTAKALHRHVTYMHTQEPKYKCTLCEKAFKRAMRLKPKEADDIPTVICSPCWLSVETFHTFYEHIKEAHCSFQEIKPAIEVIDDEFLEGTAVSNDSRFSYSKTITNEEIKIEKCDSITESSDMVCNINPIEIFVQNDNEPEINIKSDSESEMPLSALVQLHKKDKIAKKLTRKKKENTSGSCLKETKKYQTKNKSEKNADSEEEKLHILDGKWLAKCYAEETYSKPINSEELDKFLEINIDLLCGICQQPMADFSCLHPHFAKYHNGQKPYVSCCGLKLKFRSQIIDHILYHKIPDYFKCPECSKVWPSRRNLKEHLSTHNKNFTYHCDKCPKSFCSQTAVDRHQEIHFEEKPFKCVECQKFYATEYRLKQHAYNTHHYKKICEQCGQVFREKDTFVRHLLKHSNQPKPIFQCHLCSAQLSSKKILQKHIKFQHLESSGEQNCNLCGITVKNLQALKRHLNFVHKYQREFKCTMCDKAFKRALTLKIPDCQLKTALESIAVDPLLETDFDSGITQIVREVNFRVF